MEPLKPPVPSAPQGPCPFNGPWAISGNTGTGAYSNLSGHGEIGAVVDFRADPLTGMETYVGFVTLK